MENIVVKKIESLTSELNSLLEEQDGMQKRHREIEIRIHQIVGAISELQQIITSLDHQPSVLEQVVDCQASEPQHPQE